MSGQPPAANEHSALPVIPRPPKGPAAGGRRRQQSDRRGAIWAASMLVGVALGVVLYRFVPQVATYFDYWVASFLG